MTDFREITGITNAWVREIPRNDDNRGYFLEEFRVSHAPMAVPAFVQDSISYSKKRVLRGLHLQVDQWQLVTVLRGDLVDVLVDLSSDSPTYLKSVSLKLSDSGSNQLLLRPGIAHGYAVTSSDALIHYKSNIYYGDSVQFGIHWKSEEFADYWPSDACTVSERDDAFPSLKELLASLDLGKTRANFLN